MTQQAEQTQDTAGGRMCARWTRMAAVGLLIAALAPIIFIVAGLATGLATEDLPFFIVVAAIGLIGAALVWRFGTWSKVVGILAALAMGMALFWLVFSVGYVGSFVDFTAGVVLPLGILLALVGSIAAIVRRRTKTPRAEGAERRVIQVAIALVAVAAILSGVLHVTGRESAASTDADLVVRMDNLEFDDDLYTTQAGRSTVLVRNNDAFVHTFTIDELSINESIYPGSSKLVALNADIGTYTLYCVPHTSDPEDPSEDDMAAEINAG